MKGQPRGGRERGRRRTVGEGERKAPPPLPVGGERRGGGGSDRRRTAWAAATALLPSSRAPPPSHALRPPPPHAPSPLPPGRGRRWREGEKKCVTRRKVTWRSRRKVEFVGAREKFVGLCVTWPTNLNFTCHASLKFVGLADELKRHMPRKQRPHT